MATENLPPELTKSPKAPRGRQKGLTDALREKGAQSGIASPSASDQTALLIIRLNLAATRVSPEAVSTGLRRLCRLFAALDSGDKKIDVLDDKTGRPTPTPLSAFHFSATIGFGEGFFDLLRIPEGQRPAKLKAMPDHEGLGDVTPYSLGQTDLIIQLGSSRAFVNRWVLENTLEPAEGDKDAGEVPPDIVTAVAGWATITDTHAGFQRTDGRNLQGFNDGVSNPRAGSDQFNEVVWSTDEMNPALRGGTYMVFQKIVHDLDQWRELELDEQQEWVGRSKRTGLLLGTLEEEEDDELAKKIQAGNDEAFARWKKLFDLQSNPAIPFFSPEKIDDTLPDVILQAIKAAGETIASVKAMAARIAARCPAWSHVRKVNPRGADGTDFRIIFRRGYPFEESSLDNKIRSGLLFVSFQNDIEARFEFIKKQWAGNRSFPVPLLRQFTDAEIVARHKFGRLSADELQAIDGDKDKRVLIGLADQEDFDQALADAKNPESAGQQTGREGLAGPSEHGTVTSGEFLAIVPLGGGYYFVPPVPAGGIENIGQQFLATGAPTGPAGARVLVAAAPPKQVPYKIVPMKHQPHKRRPSVAAPPAAVDAVLPLVYHGGALIASVEVFTIFLGAAWQTTQKGTAERLNKFFQFIVTSPLIDQLAEYSVDAFPIKHGKFAGTATFPRALPHVMRNARVQTTLRQLIAANQVKAPTPNTLYFIFLPPGIVSELQGELSCQTFCGFHDHIGGQIFYAVIPFATCPGCTRGFNIFDSLTRVSSHELCEAITNPAEGGWFTEPPDGSPGDEIGDLCSEGTKQLGDFQVQTEFSNKARDCV